MKKLLIATVALTTVLLAGCVSIVKVEGEQTVNGRMSVRLSDAWNKFTAPGQSQPYETWTQEGMALDQLRLWAALPSGKPLMERHAGVTPPGQKAPRSPTFEAGMPPDQLVSIFEIMYSADGSIVSTTKVEPAVFAGEKGVRFEFAYTRKGDGVQLNGVGWASQRKGELFAATYVAPRLSFFQRLLPKAENVVKTAQIKG